MTRFAPILAAIGVAVGAFVWLSHVNPAFLVTDDEVRDKLLVRDCTDLGYCHLIGAPASLPGFHQGAVWVDLQVAIRLLGGDASSERIVVLALLAFGIATLFVVLWLWVRPSIALPAAVFLLCAMSLDESPNHPALSAFPDVLTAAGLVCYGLSGRRRFLILSAVMLGMGINVHVGSLALVLPLVAIAGIGRPRPWGALLASMTVLIATGFITSRAALLANLIGIARYAGLIVPLIGGLALAGVAVCLGSRFRRLPWDVRAWLMGFILVVPFCLASLWLVFCQNHPFSMAYLHPILGPAAALGAAIVSLPFECGASRFGAVRWVPTGALMMVIIFGGVHVLTTDVPVPSESQLWTLADVRVIANEAMKRGWSYENLIFHIQSRACRELLVGMSVNAPLPSLVPAAGHRHLQVVKGSIEDVPAVAGPQDIVALGGKEVVVLREIESWLEPELLVACRRPIGSERPPVCAAAKPRQPSTLTPERFLFVMRSFPEIHSLDLPPPYVATYEIPLSPGAGESRDLTLTDRDTPKKGGPESACDWRITGLQGVHVEGQLPTRHVRLHSDGGSPGLLIVERTFGTTECASDAVETRYPPCVFEAMPGDPLETMMEPD